MNRDLLWIFSINNYLGHLYNRLNTPLLTHEMTIKYMWDVIEEKEYSKLNAWGKLKFKI